MLLCNTLLGGQSLALALRGLKQVPFFSGHQFPCLQNSWEGHGLHTLAPVNGALGRAEAGCVVKGQL